MVHGRDREEVEAVQNSIGAYSSVCGDLGTAEGCAAVIEQLGNLESVDILVNNAGIFGAEDFFQISDEEWLRYFQVNIMSSVRLRF